MPTNAAERYLTKLAERSFLKLWTIPNPFSRPGKELTDLLVVFGNAVLIISDKASAFKSDDPHGWTRWVRRTIKASSAQLSGALRNLKRADKVFLDANAKDSLRFNLPVVADQRIHLITIARPSHDPRAQIHGWSPLTYDSRKVGGVFVVGPEYVAGHFVHIFESETIEFLLSQLDTAPDFLAYLESREAALRSAPSLRFAERDLFATAVHTWKQGGTFAVELPPADASGHIDVREGLWADYMSNSGATLVSRQYANSKNIDLLVEHFHEEYEQNRMLMLTAPKPSYFEHERAMRMLASESRFSRRVIADALIDLLNEPDTATFWAATIPSPELNGVRYVWLTFPELPQGVAREEYERHIQHHLRRHILVARLTFGPGLLLGIGLPNTGIAMQSQFMMVFDGTMWSDDNQAEALHWRSKGVFSNLEETERLYRR